MLLGLCLLSGRTRRGRESRLALREARDILEQGGRGLASCRPAGAAERRTEDGASSPIEHKFAIMGGCTGQDGAPRVSAAIHEK